MSAWSSATTGKPQFSYAERLRKAQGTSAASAAPTTPTPKLSQLSQSASTLGQRAKEAGPSSSPTTSPKIARQSLPQTSAAPPTAPAIPNGIPATLASAAAHIPAATPSLPSSKAADPSVNVWEARRKAMAEKVQAGPATSSSSEPSAGAPQSAATRSLAAASAPSKSAASVPASKGMHEASAASTSSPVITLSKSQAQAPSKSAASASTVTTPAGVALEAPPLHAQKANEALTGSEAANLSPPSSAGVAPLTDNAWLDRIQMLNGGRNIPSFEAAGPSPTSQALPKVPTMNGTALPVIGRVDLPFTSLDPAPSSRTSVPSGSGASEATQGHGRRKSSTSRSAGRGRRSSASERRSKQHTQNAADERKPPSLEDPTLWPSPTAAVSTPASPSHARAGSSTRPAESHSGDAEVNGEDATRDTDAPAKALEGLEVKLARPIDATKATKKGGKQWIPIVPTITHTSPLPPRDKRPSQSDKTAAPRRSSKTNGSSAGASNRRTSKSQGSVAKAERQDRDGAGAVEGGKANGDANSAGGKANSVQPSAGATSALKDAGRVSRDQAPSSSQDSKRIGAGSSTQISVPSTPARRSIDASRPAHLPATPPKAATPPLDSALDATAASFGTAVPILRLGAIQPRPTQPRPHTDGSFSPTRRQHAPANGEEVRSGSGNSTRGSRGPGRGRGRGGARGAAALAAAAAAAAGASTGGFTPVPGLEGADQVPYPPGPYPPLVYTDGFYTYAPYPAGGAAGSWPGPPRAPAGVSHPFVAGVPVALPEFSVPTLAMSDGGPTHQLLTQIEFYFSHRNLEGDFFLRQCMDEQGWVPLERVASFKRVKSITEDINVVRDTLLYSTVLQVDVTGNRVRKAFGWEQYVLAGAAKHVPSEGSIAAASAGNAAAAVAAAAAVGAQPSPAQSHRSASTSAAPSSSAADRLHPSAGLSHSANSMAGGLDGQSSSTQLTESNVSKSSTAFSSPPSSFGRAASQSGDDSRDARGSLLIDDDDDDDDDGEDDDDQETLGVVAAEGLGGALSTKPM